MNHSAKRFVVATRDGGNRSKFSVQRDDVGVVSEESKETATVFFIRVWKEITLPKDEVKIFDVKKVGDAFSKKICNICHKLLSTTEFAKNQNGKNNRTVRRPSCRECRKQLEGINVASKEKREWQKSKPEHEPFECPICAKRTIAGITSKVVLEHDHRSGKIRGWVCDSCNTGIGRFKDDTALLSRAIKFLK